MITRFVRISAHIALVLLALSPSLATAAAVGRQLVASDLLAPMFTTHAPGDPTRLFIAERGVPDGSDNATARIRILNLATGTLEPTPFLSITGLNDTGEGGLLGLAFHPDYADNGKFYVYVTANGPVAPFSSYIREYTVSANPNVADPGSMKPILDFMQPNTNHNGGWIGFSPNDNYLYIMSGDGGDGNDSGAGHTEPRGNAQDITANFLGKALRVDVDGDDFPADASKNYAIPPTNPFVGVTGDDEIWAYGLRNPFRAGFDRITGDLWIGDVGQGRREEVDFQPGDSAGGQNYGWRQREGLIATPGISEAPAPNAIDPIWDYKQNDSPDLLPADADFVGQTVIGGVPYRGPDPSLQGVYFFCDNATNRIWTLRRPKGGGSPIVQYVSPALPTNTGSPFSPSAISEDANGNVYITYLSGSVYRIVTNEVIPGDFDGNGVVDGDDLSDWQASYNVNAAADADADGDSDGADFLVWQRNFGRTAQDLAPLSGSIAVPEPATLGLVALGLLSYLWSRRR